MKQLKNSRLLIATIFGIYAALGSLPHGIGLMLQGHGKPESIVLDTWTVGPIAKNLGGEPGMTIIPNFWISGILTIILSVVMILWITLFINKKYGGLVYIILTIAVLLTGGGFAPPTISLLAGIATVTSHMSNTWLYKPDSAAGRLLARIWPWVFGFSAIIGGFVFIIGIILSALNLLNAPNIFVYGFFYLIIAIIYLNITGPAYDHYKFKI